MIVIHTMRLGDNVVAHVADKPEISASVPVWDKMTDFEYGKPVHTRAAKKLLEIMGEFPLEPHRLGVSQTKCGYSYIY